MTMLVYSFIIFLSAGLAKGAAVDNKIGVPGALWATTLYPAGIRLNWEPLEEQSDDPIIGYRMKVWELVTDVYSYELNEDGEQKLIMKTVPIEDRDSFDASKETPKWIIDVGPEANKADVNGVTSDVFYELRVQAITRNGEGPLSSWTRVKINSS